MKLRGGSREDDEETKERLLIWRTFAEHEGRILRLEGQMADITQAQADLAAQVDATLGEIATLEGEVTKLKDALAAAPSDPAVQAAADAIEAQVAKLKGAMPVPPAPATPPPADVPPPATP